MLMSIQIIKFFVNLICELIILDSYQLKKFICEDDWKTDFCTSPKINCKRHLERNFAKENSYKVYCKQNSSKSCRKSLKKPVQLLTE